MRATTVVVEIRSHHHAIFVGNKQHRLAMAVANKPHPHVANRPHLHAMAVANRPHLLEMAGKLTEAEEGEGGLFLLFAMKSMMTVKGYEIGVEMLVVTGTGTETIMITGMGAQG